MHQPEDGVGWIAISPDWNITFFNNKTKLYYPCSYNTWTETVNKYKITPSDIKWVKVNSSYIAKIKASEYKASNISKKSQEQNNAIPTSLTCWFADEIKMPGKLAQLINSICGLSASDSIPLRISYYDTNNEIMVLNTYRQQQAKIPEQTFYLPSNYKLANSLTKVLLNEKKTKSLFDAVYQSNKKAAMVKALGKDPSVSGSNLSLDKIPEHMTWNGKTITKEEIKKAMNKFINQSK